LAAEKEFVDGQALIVKGKMKDISETIFILFYTYFDIRRI